MTDHASTVVRNQHAGRPAPGSRRGLALGLLCLAQLMLILDVTVVNVALPDIGSGLGLDRTMLTWVLTTYTMVFGGLMLLGGRLADHFGARRVLVTGLAVFVAASMVSGLAVNGGMLIAGRAGQGIGAAMLSPSALSLVTTMFTGAERNRALGAWAAVGGSGAAIGVILGGVLTSSLGWAWVFFINVPLGLAVLAAVPAIVPAGPARRDRMRIDVPGALTVTAATGAGIYGLVNAGSNGWTATSTWAPIIAAVVLYASFGVLERRVTLPLMDPRALRERALATGALLMLIATGLLVGAFFLGSFYLQLVRGYSALSTGLTFLPVAVAAVVGAHTASRLVGRVDRRGLTAPALTLAAVGAAVAARWHGPVPLITGMTVAALGIGATLVAATTTALANVDPGQAGLRSGLVSTFHEFGSALGVAVLSTLAAPSIAAVTGSALNGAAVSGAAVSGAAVSGAAVSGAAGGPGLSGFTRAFTASAIAALAAALLAVLVAPPGKADPGAVPVAH